MRKFITLLLAGAIAFLTHGCGSEDGGDVPSDEPEVLYFEPIGYGRSGSIADTTEVVIRTAGEWAAYRDSLNPVAPFDSVDFAQGIVLLAALPQTTSGHSIEFASIEETDSVAIAEYVVNIPAEDCLTAVAETVPFQAVMVRRTDRPVIFRHDTEEYRCTFGRRR